MKKILLVITVLLVLSLFGCDNDKYIETGKMLNGNMIYSYDTKAEICAEWYSISYEIDEERTYELLNHCPIGHVVLIDDEYISIFDYIEQYEIDDEELINSGLGYLNISTSIQNVFDIDLNEFILDSIIVKELNNEIMIPPQWDTSETIDLDFVSISEDINFILSEPLGIPYLSCEDIVCRLTYSQGPINISLINGERELLIELYENHIHIHIFNNGEFEAVVYYIDSPIGNIANLYGTIYQEYLVINE